MFIDRARLTNTLHRALAAHLANLESGAEDGAGGLAADEVREVLDGLSSTCEIHAYLSGGVVWGAACAHPLRSLINLEVVDFDVEGMDSTADATPVDGGKSVEVRAYYPSFGGVLQYTLDEIPF